MILNYDSLDWTMMGIIELINGNSKHSESRHLKGTKCSKSDHAIKGKRKGSALPNSTSLDPLATYQRTYLLYDFDQLQEVWKLLNWLTMKRL